MAVKFQHLGRRGRKIPGVGAQNLAVMHPYRLPLGGQSATQWLANLPWWTMLLLLMPLVLWPVYGHAAGKFTITTAFSTLTKWIPFLFMSGFLFNILISMFAMLFGTVAGAVLGLGQISNLLLCGGPAGSSPNCSVIRLGW